MSLGSSVQIVVDGIVAASERQDWNAIQRLSERVQMIILDATADRNRSGLSEVAAALELAEAIFPDSGNDAPLARVGWMLKMDATLAKLAARRIPTARTNANDEDRSARDRILRALAHANSAPCVASIAAMSGLARETVSRLLPAMAHEGFVKYRKVGRRTLSRITPKGRAAIGEKPVDAGTSIRNAYAIRTEFVSNSSSVAKKRAHQLVDHRAKRKIWNERDRGSPWLGAFTTPFEEVLSVRNDQLPHPRTDVAQLINNSNVRNGRDLVMEVPA